MEVHLYFWPNEGMGQVNVQLQSRADALEAAEEAAAIAQDGLEVTYCAF